MKLPKNYFESLSATRYREYLKLLPKIQSDNSKAILTLIFTFAAMTFFGFFAINPTLSTIITLKKQLADSTFVNQQLTTKIANLSNLQGRYNEILPDLPYITDAIPQNPSAPTLMGQIQALSDQQKIQLLSLKVTEVQLTGFKELPNSPGSSFAIFIVLQGNYDSMLTFATSLTRLNRILTIDSISIGKDQVKNVLNMEIRARTYAKK